MRGKDDPRLSRRAGQALRRRKAFELRNGIPGVRMALPESGFLGWIGVSGPGRSTEVAKYLLKSARVIDALVRVREALLSCQGPLK